MKRRWAVVLVVVGCICAFVPQASAQSGDSQVIVTVDGQKVRMLGFVATGPQPDLQRLLAAAASTLFVSKELIPPASPEVEVMVIFKPGSSPQAALDFLARAKSSEFSSLKVGEMILPISP